MRARTRWTAGVTAVAVSVVIAGCGSADDGPGDVPTVAPATAAVSPRDTAAPAGAVTPAPGGSDVAVAGSTVAALTGDGVRLYGTGAPTQAPPREVKTGALVAIVADGDGFVGLGAKGLVQISSGGDVREVPVTVDGPLTLAIDGDKTLVGTSRGHLLVVGEDGRLAHDIAGFKRVDGITVAPRTAANPGQVVVVDRAQSSVTPVDVDTGELKAALRAGNGVTDSVVDRFGRVIASNTRDDQLVAFFGQPLVMRFRYPVAGSPYALAYDEKRDILWVSTTGDNQAIAFDLSSGEPVETDRIPTVGQVGAMAVDPRDGTLYLLSARGDGLQAVPAGNPR
ncbi:MAG: hypothetical protein QM658_03815 [Gordonia sp. (in: high G+C Gram-positive bacteria)]